MSQLDLFERPALVVRPVPLEEPRFWVRRFVLFREAGDILRDVALRPGLNVVWSPDAGPGGLDLGAVRTMGHGSGKTLFCRLLRYALGEARFAAPEQRDRIARRFEDGFVGLEVRLDGRDWSLLRPIGTGRRHLASDAHTLDELLQGEIPRTGIEPFVTAATNAFMEPALAELVPGTRADRAWTAALAWLSRDQECRFHHLLDWRASSTELDSPIGTLGRERVLDTFRALIGAIDPEEYRLRGELAELEREHRQLQLEADRLAWLSERQRTDLARALALDGATVPPGSLGIEMLQKAARERHSESAGSTNLVPLFDLGEMRRQQREAAARVAELRDEQTRSEAQRPILCDLLARVEAERPGASARLNEAAEPICPVCLVPIDRALAESCGVSKRLPDLAECRADYERLRQEIARLTAQIDALDRRKEPLANELEHASAQYRRLSAQIDAFEQARAARDEEKEEARAQIRSTNTLSELHRSRELLSKRIDEKEEEIAHHKDLIKARRNSHEQLMNRLSGHFDYAARALVGRHASGELRLHADSLKATVQLAGDQSTAAMDSLKVIAFDLAALMLSIEGKTLVPAFLVHDSPREADLGLSVYSLIFKFAAELEQVGGKPLFQYILTTTTDPPATYQGEPYQRLLLSGGPPEQRLLRVDL